MSAALFERRAGVLQLLRNWTGSYTGNFAGAVTVAALAAASRGILHNPAVREAVISGAAAKTSRGFAALFILGMLCNWLVDLAIWMFNRAEGTMGKAFLAWIPIFAFVAMGFEHSIANMWIIPAAIFLPGSGVTWADLMFNLIPVTLGNAAGGILFVTIPYAYLAGKKGLFENCVKSLLSVITTAVLFFALPLVWVSYISRDSLLFIMVFILNGIVITAAAERLYRKRSVDNG